MIQKELFGKKLLFFDGGMGTLLQEMGLAPGELPEMWNVTRPDAISSIHRQYIEAGCHILLTNTFGANALKFHDDKVTVEELIFRAVSLAKEAAKEADDVRIALDMGPTGKLLAPLGDLSFARAYEAFAQAARAGEAAGADLIHIETMSDLYELKAAVLAAKENTDLPVFATVIFDERGKLLTGADVPAVVATLEGLGVDALGVNCGLGPDALLDVVDEMLRYASVPVIAKPNAGLPIQREGRTVYDIDPDAFARQMESLIKKGVWIAGGCCGTTPAHIRALTKRCGTIVPPPVTEKEDTIVCAYADAVVLGGTSKIIGERINPTGKKRFKEALKQQDMDHILREAITQQDQGAHILDVNVGLPDIDEPAMMERAVLELQAITSLPLQIDTVDGQAMERALRLYNGKAMINSVSGKQSSMDMVFPLAAKYGGVIVGLTLDETGIPDTADGRIAIAEKIIETAAAYGIKKKDIVIDALAMTVSSDQKSALVTLETIRRLRRDLGVHTVLGVSNISFGLPRRDVVNAAFYTMALQSGLSCGILNPGSEPMMDSWYAYHALADMDANCAGYVNRFSSLEKPAGKKDSADTVRRTDEAREDALSFAIQKGLKDDAVTAANEALLDGREPLSIISEQMVPALDAVGKGFENRTVFLPQLLMSAEAAKAAFAVLKEKMAGSGQEQEKKGTIVLATVRGDIHDIGKNIVKVLLENYSFRVIDLGKDVPPGRVLDAVRENDVRLVGLSALMTTTVVSMEETIRLLHEEVPDCKVMVGGAVLNPEYAKMIQADFYGKDAMQSVYYAQTVFGS